ncbi:MAG: LPS-assembly protein LptD [Bacteroidales bacterium]|nr:LPS-assembly protein LptD [Bacteroidales bacterium]
MRILERIVPILLLLTLTANIIPAQNVGRRGARRIFSNAVPKTAREIVLDSAALARRDSIHVADSLHRIDSAALRSKSSLEMPAFSQAKDSIVEVFTDGQRMIYYYGDVSVEYQDMKLTAAYMQYNMKTGTVFAKGVYDSLNGVWTGRPVMTQGGKTYNMDEVKYNFDTKKSSIKNILTTEESAILHGGKVKMMPDRSINMTNGKYTVCDMDHPHYYLALTSAKVMTEPSQKTVFGPAYLVVEDVKLPFVGLPFGFIPKRPERATGLLMPNFGEENARGFYMKDAGMYFVFGDYLDLSLTGDYFTLGSWAVNVNSRYMVKYKFNGNFGFTYSHDQTGEPDTPDFNEYSNFSVKWSHTQDSKAHPGTTFSASVNFSSPSNSRFNSRSVNEALQNQISSSISYSKNWNGKFNLSINALHSQSSRDSSYAFTLPNVTFSISTFYPFKRKVRVGKERFYEKFSIGYNTTLQNKINFKASEFGQEGFLDRFQNGMTHNFSIGLPNFQILKYLNVNPSVSYGMNWMFRKREYAYNPETDKVEEQPSTQFNTFGITQQYSGSIALTTRLYGTFNFGSYRRIQAIRHVISPSVSMSFNPELGTHANGYRTLHYTDIHGKEQTYEYNIYRGQVYGPPGKGRAASANITIGNNLEAKVRDFADTTGTGSKKVKLIDQLNISTSYNFLADSLRMSNVNLSMSTSLFNKISISGSASFDPYAVGPTGSRISKFAITQGQGLLRLNNISASASYSISGDGSIKGNDGIKDPTNRGDSGGSVVNGAASYYQRYFYHPVTGEFIPGGWLYYTNPNVPWSLSFSYSFSMNRQMRLEEGVLKPKNNITQTLQASGSIKLTPRLNINASSGFDLQAMKITTTQFSFTYDLHCFNISVSWVPTGNWASYQFRIAANASALADLLQLKKSSSYWDNFK